MSFICSDGTAISGIDCTPVGGCPSPYVYPIVGASSISPLASNPFYFTNIPSGYGPPSSEWTPCLFNFPSGFIIIQEKNWYSIPSGYYPLQKVYQTTDMMILESTKIVLPDYVPITSGCTSGPTNTLYDFVEFAVGPKSCNVKWQIRMYLDWPLTTLKNSSICGGSNSGNYEMNIDWRILTLDVKWPPGGGVTIPYGNILYDHTDIYNNFSCVPINISTLLPGFGGRPNATTYLRNI